MAGGVGILGGYGLRQRVKPQRVKDIELYVDRLARNSLQMDSSGNVDIIGILQILGTGGAIALGTTPPTSATVGTGIWIDRTGMYGLASNVQQAIFDATTGKITAGAGVVVLDTNGIGITVTTTAADARKFKFLSGASVIGALSSYVSASEVYNAFYTQASNTGKDGTVDLSVLEAASGKTAKINFYVEEATPSTAYLRLTALSGVTALATDADTVTLSGSGLNVGTATGAATGALKASGQLESTLATGTAPLVVASTTAVSNLNADKWDGQDYTDWTDWTPTVTQSGSVTVTVTEAKYAIVGKVCHIYAKVTCTSAGTGGNVISIGGQPAAAQPALTGVIAIGTGHVFDNNIANYWGIVMPNTATDFQIINVQTEVQIGVNPNIALANGDTIDFHATYRVA